MHGEGTQYSRAGFVLFSLSQITSAGTIQGQGEFKKIRYIYMYIYISRKLRLESDTGRKLALDINGTHSEPLFCETVQQINTYHRTPTLNFICFQYFDASQIFELIIHCFTYQCNLYQYFSIMLKSLVNVLQT